MLLAPDHRHEHDHPAKDRETATHECGGEGVVCRASLARCDQAAGRRHSEPNTDPDVGCTFGAPARHRHRNHHQRKPSHHDSMSKLKTAAGWFTRTSRLELVRGKDVATLPR
jgi:hypothetical protein